MSVIAVFGGTGFIGSCLSEKLVARGYRVRLLVRDPIKAREFSGKEGFEVVEGALPDLAAITKCIEGGSSDFSGDPSGVVSGVINVTGQRGRSKAEMQTLVEGNRNIIVAMEALGVNPYIKISGTSVRLPGEKFPLMRHLLDIAFRVLLPNPTRCKYLEQEDILSSKLDWVMVRPPAIVDKPANKPLQAHEYQHLGMSVSREDLCEFMIDQLDSSRWLHRCPVLGYKRV